MTTVEYRPAEEIMAAPTERFIELLEEDIARARELAEAWAELEKSGGRLETADGKLIATAGDMVTRCRNREKELRSLIESVRLPKGS
jgi:hypothetical protein